MSRLLELEMMGQKPLVTGQLLLRDANGGIDLPPGMKLMMVCGVIAVPENFPVPCGNMVRVRGFANRDSVELHTEPEGKPVGEKYNGWTMNDMMMQPIWQV